MAVLASAASAQSSSGWGLPVVQIDLQTDADLRLSQFHQQLLQQVGQPLDPVLVDATLKKLYATGRFTDLRADAEPAPGGVKLLFIGKAQYFIGSVYVEGKFKPLNASTLIAATRLNLGHALRESNLTKAEANLQRLLVDNAYYRPQITFTVERQPSTQLANIFFTVDVGPPARASKIVFEGKPGYPASRLLAVAKWKLGKHLTSAEIEKGLFKIHNFYIRKGHLQSNTTIRKRVFEPKTGTEVIYVQADAGPTIRIHLRGAKVSTSTLRDILPMYQDGVVDDAALQRGAEALEDHFQQKGYFFVQVSVESVQHPRADEIAIYYQIHRGPQGEFVGFKFAGNQHVPDSDLLRVMTIHRAGLVFEKPAYSRRQLDDDLDSLRAVCHSQGFLSAQVTPQFDYNYHHHPNELFITLQIAEGPQTKVGRLELEGVSAEEHAQLLPRLANRPGQPYAPRNEQKDRNAILQYFANRGYLHAQASASSTPVDKTHVVNVRYVVEPGRQEFIRRVVLLGNEHTRDGTVRRELSFRPGQPANETDLFESQRRLYDLGLFNQVQIAPENPGTVETQKSILVNMEEAQRWTVGYGGGLEVQRLGSNEPQGQFKASPRVSLDVSRLGVGGRDQTASFQGRLSALDKGAELSYYIPRFSSRRDIGLRFNASADYSQNVLTFTAKRQEVSLLFEKRWSANTVLSAGYSYRNVQALNLSNRISPDQIPLFSLPARIGMFTAGYISDLRDDPIDPTRGSYTLADAGVSASGLGSEANFLRFSAQNATYYRLAPHLIFARNTRFAVESPYGGLRQVVTTGPDGKPQTVLTHDIPLPERFFMGGSDSHRGFSINQAGPRDLQTGFPIGGNALFLNSLELRVPVSQNQLGIVLFHDMGNVYSTVRKLRLFKVHQSSPTDFDYTVHAVGLGFLYKTPVGPLRFDVGYDLNPPDYRTVVKVNGVEEVRQQSLPHVQFFLSIGQSF